MPNPRQAARSFLFYALNDQHYKNEIETLVIFEEFLAQLGSIIKQKFGHDEFDSLMRAFLDEKEHEELKQRVLISQNRKARG